MVLYSPGKLYPGKVASTLGSPGSVPGSKTPLRGFRTSNKEKDGCPTVKTLNLIREQLTHQLGLEDRWLQAKDPQFTASASIWVLPLDFQGGKMDHRTLEHSPGRTIGNGGTGRVAPSAQSTAGKTRSTDAGSCKRAEQVSPSFFLLF